MNVCEMLTAIAQVVKLAAQFRAAAVFIEQQQVANEFSCRSKDCEHPSNRHSRLNLLAFPVDERFDDKVLLLLGQLFSMLLIMRSDGNTDEILNLNHQGGTTGNIQRITGKH